MVLTLRITKEHCKIQLYINGGKSPVVEYKEISAIMAAIEKYIRMEAKT